MAQDEPKPSTVRTAPVSLTHGIHPSIDGCRHGKAGWECIHERNHAKTQRPMGVISWHDTRQAEIPHGGIFPPARASSHPIHARSYACDQRSRRCYARMAQTTQRGRHCRLRIYPLRCPSDARTAMAQTTRTIVICAAPIICEIAAVIRTQSWETQSLT